MRCPRTSERILGRESPARTPSLFYASHMMWRVRPRPRPVRASIGLTFLVLGCASATTRAGKDEPTLLDLVKAAQVPSAEAPRWVYHPKRPAELFDEVAIGDGSVLMVGERGERWLVRRQLGTAEVSSWPLPETLVGVTQLGQQWFFIGAEGTSYSAMSPLGRPGGVRLPPESLTVAEGRGGAMVGITARGGLMASTDAAQSWVGVGPASARFTDVAIDTSGRGFAVATPEALWAADGVTGEWKPVDVDPFGAQKVDYEEGSGFVVEGILGRFTFSSTTRSLSPRVRGVAPEPLELGVAVPLAPSAAAIGEGRAALDGDDYIELERSRDGWRLLHGRLAGPLEARTAKALDDCAVLRLAHRGQNLVVLCGAEPAPATLQVLTLFRSVNHGRSWVRLPQRIRGMVAEARLALGGSGDVLMSGVCPPKESTSGCLPRGVYRYRPEPRGDGAPRPPAAAASGGRRRSGGMRVPVASSLTVAALPDLVGIADELLISDDDTRLYVIGRRAKTGQYAVYVSDETGGRFSVQDLGPLPAPFVHTERDVDAESVRRDSFVRAASIGRDGSLSVLLATRGEQLLVGTDSRGEVRTIARPPDEVRLLATKGSRILGLEPASGTAWESSDGGASWAAVEGLPRPLCPGDSSCSVPFVCSAAGCLVADEWTHLGWGLAKSQEQALPSRTPSAVPELGFGPVLTCQFDQSTSWRRIPGALRPPRADDAALGSASWFAVASDPGAVSASVTVLRRGHASPDIEVLLPPITSSHRHAFHVSPQVEGAAALRYLVPESGGASTNLRGIEVAWLNLFTGKHAKVRVAEGGPYRPGDTSKVRESVQVAHPNLLSIAGDGLFLRVHAVSTGSQPTYFLDGRNTTTLAPVTLTVPVGEAHHEMARVGGESIALVMTKSGAVMRGRQEGTTWRWSAFALTAPNPSRFRVSEAVDITYQGDVPALYVTSSSVARTSAAVYPLLRDGAVVGKGIPAPTLADVQDVNVPCVEHLRRTTPRVVGFADAESRIPIVVRDALDPERVLVSGRAVLHGSPESACVAAVEAGEVGEPFDGRRLSALLYPGDLEHSWAFRVTADGDERQVEFRIMECRPDPDRQLPAKTLDEIRMRLGATTRFRAE